MKAIVLDLVCTINVPCMYQYCAKLDGTVFAHAISICIYQRRMILSWRFLRLLWLPLGFLRSFITPPSVLCNISLISSPLLLNQSSFLVAALQTHKRAEVASESPLMALRDERIQKCTRILRPEFFKSLTYRAYTLYLHPSSFRVCEAVLRGRSRSCQVQC